MLSIQKASKNAQGGGGKSFKTTKSMATKFQPPTHPAVIITSAFTAPHIEKLKNKLQENYIAYGMQTSKKKLNRPPGAPTDKNFIIVDDSQGSPILEGQFLNLNMCRVDYPKKNNLDTVIQKFDKYIGLGKETVEVHQNVEQLEDPSWEEHQEIQRVGKTLNKNRNITNTKGGYSEAFNGINSKLNIENLENVLQVKEKFDQFRDVFKKKSKSRLSVRGGSSSSKSSKSKNKKKQVVERRQKNSKQIALKSVKRYGQVQENVEYDKRSLFILKTEKQSQRYKEFVGVFEQSKNKRIKVIRSLQEYYKSCYQAGEGQNCLLLSPNIAFKELHKFRNLKDVYIYGDDPKFCAQLVKGNIKNAAVDPNEMERILMAEGFNKNQLKSFIQPMRKIGSRMNIPDQNQKPLKTQKQKDKDQQKPSLFGRFVDFVKGKSKKKDNDNDKQKGKGKQQEKEKEKEKKQRQKQQEKQNCKSNKKKRRNSRSSSSSLSASKKKAQLNKLEKKQVLPNTNFLNPNQESNRKGMISLGQIVEKSKGTETEEDFDSRKKQPKVTVIRIKSNNKITNNQLYVQNSVAEPQQTAYKVGGSRPTQMPKAQKQNNQASFVLSKPPPLEQAEGNKPKQKDKQADQNYGYKDVQVPNKEEKDKKKVGNTKKGDDYKQLRFNIQKPQQSQNDLAAYNIPKKKQKKKKPRLSSSSSDSSSFESLNIAAKVQKNKQKQRTKKKKIYTKQKQSSQQDDGYYAGKPQYKPPQKEKQKRKLSHKVQDITEQYEHKIESTNKMSDQPQNQPSRNQGGNNKKLKNQQKVAPAFCQQNPSQTSENQGFFNKNVKKSKLYNQRKRKQSEQNYGYYRNNKKDEFAQTVPPSAFSSEFNSQYQNKYPNKLEKSNNGHPNERGYLNRQSPPAFNQSLPSAPKSDPNQKLNFNPNSPHNQQQLRSSLPNQQYLQSNGQPEQQMQQPQSPRTNLTYPPPLYPPSKPLGQCLNSPPVLGHLKPVAPSNDNFNRPLSYSTHIPNPTSSPSSPNPGFNLPFDETKYDKTIQNGIVVYRPKKIPFQLGIMPTSIIGEAPPILNSKPPLLSVHLCNLNPNLIYNGRESPNKVYQVPKISQEQKPLKSTGSTYYKKLSDAPLLCSIPSPKNSPFSTYQYFMNNNQLPIYSPSPRKQSNTDRITPCKSVLIYDKPIESEVEQPIYECDCKYRDVNPKPKLKNSEYGEPSRKRPQSKKGKQNMQQCHFCDNPTKFKKNLTKTKQAFFNNLDSDDSSSQMLSYRKKRNTKSLSKSGQPFNSSILDNISSRVNKQPVRVVKNYTILYLVSSKINSKIMKEIFEISDESDTIQTYPQNQPEKISQLIKKGQNIFDFVLVFGANTGDKNEFDSLKLPNANSSKGNYYIQYDENLLQSNIMERIILLRTFSDLFVLLNGLFNSKAVGFITGIQKNSKVGYIYFKDFNFSIRKMAKQLKNQYPNCQVRRYFGLLDLPTKLPFCKNETTIILLDEVSFNQISAYCSEQQKQNPNILKICIPKSRQAMKLCQKSPTSQRIVWLTEQELDNWDFLGKRIEKWIR